MPSFDFSYEYDGAGNRSKKINNLTSEVTTYVYDSANQLISMEGPDGTTTFDWDAAGNMIAKHAPDGTTTYTWDYRNRLTQVAPPVGDPINFAYNAMGQRIQKNGTRFIYDGVQLLQETDLNNQTLRSNTFTNEGYGDLVSENDGTNSSFPTFNGQSSTDAIVNKTATVTDRISYSAFGGEDSHSGSSTTPFRFVGKQSYYRDSETGLYLLGAGGNPNGAGRYYDPELGRFISRDPIGLAGGDANLYRYAGNNPVNGVDPLGLYCTNEKGDRCGPEVTDWFERQLGIIKEKSREYWSKPLPSKKYIPFWKSLKFVDAGLKTKDCPTAKCPDTVTLCGKCIHVSELGDLAFGYAASELAGRMLWAGFYVEVEWLIGFDKEQDIAAALMGAWIGKKGLCKALEGGMGDADGIDLQFGFWLNDAESVNYWAGFKYGNIFEKWNVLHGEELGTWKEFVTSVYKKLKKGSFFDIAEVKGCAKCDAEVTPPDIKVDELGAVLWNEK